MGLAVPPGGGEARRSALRRRPGGVSSEKGALCGVGLGGRGPGAASPSLFIQPRTDGSFCGLREEKGIHGNPGVRASLHPSVPAEDRTLFSLAVPLSWCPQTWQKSCRNWVGELVRKREAVIEPQMDGVGADRCFTRILSAFCTRWEEEKVSARTSGIEQASACPASTPLSDPPLPLPPLQKTKTKN